MAAGRGNVQDDVSGAADLYAVLGLNRECTDAELRDAYRRLAMIWHPDRCSASGSSARVEEAKERFQEIQGAYSVLSDSNKRFLYDVGVYDSEDADDDLSGMGDFLGEMAAMMSQATPTESFEELQQLFVDMFQDDIVAAGCGGPAARTGGGQSARQSQCAPSTPPQTWSPSWAPPSRTDHDQRAPPTSCNAFGKRGSSTMASGKPSSSRPRRAGLCNTGLGLSRFCFKVTDETRQKPARWAYDVSGGCEGRSGRKQRPPMRTSRDGSSAASRF